MSRLDCREDFSIGVILAGLDDAHAEGEVLLYPGSTGVAPAVDKADAVAAGEQPQVVAEHGAVGQLLAQQQLHRPVEPAEAAGPGAGGVHRAVAFRLQQHGCIVEVMHVLRKFLLRRGAHRSTDVYTFAFV